MNRSLPGLIVQRRRVFVPKFSEAVSYWMKLDMAVRQEWLVKYRATILERDSNCRSRQMTEADDAIQHRLGEVEETSPERRKLNKGVQSLNVLRGLPSQPWSKSSELFLQSLPRLKVSNSDHPGFQVLAIMTVETSSSSRSFRSSELSQPI